MADKIKITNDIRSQDFRYKSRLPYLNQIRHLNDSFKNLGYDYQGKLYRNSTSPELWGNPLQIPFIGRLEGMITSVLEHAKSIKKTFSFAHDKNTIKIN